VKFFNEWDLLKSENSILKMALGGMTIVSIISVDISTHTALTNISV